MGTVDELASPEDTLIVLRQVNTLLVTLSEHIAHLPIDGALTLRQSDRISYALRVCDGLCSLFRDEQMRQQRICALKALAKRRT